MNPTRMLSRLEAFAALSCIPLTIYDYVTEPRESSNGSLIVLGVLVGVATAAAVFSLPHASHRRFLALAVGAIGVLALGTFPPHDIYPSLILGTILGSRLTFAFGARGALFGFAVTYLSIPASVASQWSYLPMPSGALIYNLAAFFVMLGLVFGIIGLLATYARSAAQSAATAERARIALDLHDSFGHSLTTLSVHLQNATRLRLSDAAKADAYVERASVLAAAVLNDVRETVSVLHDDARVEQAPILPLLDRVRSDFSAAHGLDLRWEMRFEREPVGRAGIVLYRVLQEALTNVARHAQAKRVRVDIRGDQKEIYLEVEDDGCGFDAEAPGGHGLISMRTRVEDSDGDFDLRSDPCQGTRLSVRIPLESPA